MSSITYTIVSHYVASKMIESAPANANVFPLQSNQHAFQGQASTVGGMGLDYSNPSIHPRQLATHELLTSSLPSSPSEYHAHGPIGIGTGTQRGGAQFPLPASGPPPELGNGVYNAVMGYSYSNATYGYFNVLKNNLTAITIADGNLLIRIDFVDFKVHGYFFMRDSDPFRGLSKIDSAIERLLSVLYLTRFEKFEEDTAMYWASVLSMVSNMLLQSVHSLCIDGLSIVGTPVDKIALKMTAQHYALVEG
ncbi:hypothetical protein AX16_008967 [Volvariella volvacea WC 439]|nr:hypothetical protein AX16_008967 [Volvariella volvacea WC 439]